jgi:carbonic anhydrase/acetyltransferase-like protein (isoleucine patch superfamily)
MEKKYVLTDETIEVCCHILYRIKALRDFGDVNKGDLGGFIEKEENLSHKGDCWVYGNAKVYGDAKIFEDAKVYGDAKVFGNAQIYDDAHVYGNANVYSNARVGDNSIVYGNAEVHGDAMIGGHAEIYDNAKAYDNAVVYENVKLFGDAVVADNAEISGNAEVCGDAVVDGMAEICGDAVVKELGDYMVFKNTWSSGRWFTWTRSNNKWMVGCFYGTGEELIKKAYKDYGMKGRCYEVIVKTINEILKIVNEFAPSK